MALFGGGTDAGKATIRAGQRAGLLTDEFRGRGMEAIERGEGASQGALQDLVNLYRPMTERGTQGANLYADAMGLNGAGGNTRATGAFQAGPGYQFAMDQGLDALNRTASARGMLASGNTSLDTLGFAQGLANQEYGGWMDRLGGYNSMEAAGLGGQATGLGGLADLYQGVTGQRLGVEQDYTQGQINSAATIAQGQEARTAAKEAQSNAMLGSLLNLGGRFLGSVGGPIGSAIGGKIGSSLGGFMQ